MCVCVGMVKSKLGGVGVGVDVEGPLGLSGTSTPTLPQVYATIVDESKTGRSIRDLPVTHLGALKQPGT